MHRAVELVEHLVSDVMGAAQSYRQVQEKESRLLNDLSLAQAQLFPLRKENARLARENHELHLDHIKQTEESRRETDRYAQKARELGDQITELRLMNKLYEQQVKEKDEVIEKLREVSLILEFSGAPLIFLFIFVCINRHMKRYLIRHSKRNTLLDLILKLPGK